MRGLENQQIGDMSEFNIVAWIARLNMSKVSNQQIGVPIVSNNG